MNVKRVCKVGDSVRDIQEGRCLEARGWRRSQVRQAFQKGQGQKRDVLAPKTKLDLLEMFGLFSLLFGVLFGFCFFTYPLNPQ